ncbi:MAG: Jag N-terminal domain-containing protein, partial [Clostridia bacterium]|nr:Jag N-terminal domain-containing protein [Clostridia bacterium]
MRSIEKTGKKTEDAINAGLKELGCDLADVTIDILDAGSPGLFGMFGRLAKVRLTVKEADPDLDFEMPTFSLNAQKTKTVRKSDTARKAEDAEKPVRRAPESPKAEETAAEAVKNETTEAPAKAEKPEKSEKAASPRRAERSGRRERAERPEKAERPAPKPEA